MLRLPRHPLYQGLTKAFYSSKQLNGQIKSASFISNGHRYMLNSVDVVQLLHYRFMPCTEIHTSEGPESDRLIHQRCCQLVLHLNPTDTVAEPHICRLILNSESHY
jgi:hypothetical protein